MKTNTIKPRIDYTQLVTQLNYAALEQTLAQLGERQPPKKRKQISDVLAPVEARLRELHAKGWTYEHLAKELNDFGLPVKTAALRDYLKARKAKGPDRSRQRGTAPARQQGLPHPIYIC